MKKDDVHKLIESINMEKKITLCNSIIATINLRDSGVLEELVAMLAKEHPQANIIFREAIKYYPSITSELTQFANNIGVDLN